MILSAQQDRALHDVSRWYRSKSSQIYRLFGYAGTGKTTITKQLIAEVGDAAVCMAPTGKAASVMRRSGLTNATTIHKLIYQPKDKSQKRLKELQALVLRLGNQGPSPALAKAQEELRLEEQNVLRPAFSLNRDSKGMKDAKLIVLDESSMVDEQTGQDLMSFGLPILALGDPGQLPPVKGAGYFTARKPETLLTEVHRQARDSGIIRLATDIREHGDISPTARYGDDAIIVKARDMDPAQWLAADQLLVGSNATRRAFNQRIRELRGHTSPVPMRGERVVCLRNNHDLGLLNGEQFTVNEDAHYTDEMVDLLIENEGVQVGVCCHRAPFEGQDVDFWSKRDAEEFDYGYAMTVHKSQGSSFAHTLLYDQWRSTARTQWLYTGVTRASEKIVVVRP